VEAAARRQMVVWLLKKARRTSVMFNQMVAKLTASFTLTHERNDADWFAPVDFVIALQLVGVANKSCRRGGGELEIAQLPGGINIVPLD
jgi:hypothetical protein